MLNLTTKPGVEATIRDLHAMSDVLDGPFTEEEEGWVRTVFAGCIMGRRLVYPSDVVKLDDLCEKASLHLASSR